MEATVLILDGRKERDDLMDYRYSSFPEEYNSFTDFQRTSIGPLYKPRRMYSFSFAHKKNS